MRFASANVQRLFPHAHMHVDPVLKSLSNKLEEIRKAYQLFPTVLLPFSSASRRYCAALNYKTHCISPHSCSLLRA